MVGAVKTRILRVKSGPGEQQAPLTRILRGFAVEIRPKHRFGCIFEAILSAKPRFGAYFCAKSATLQHFWRFLGGRRQDGWACGRDLGSLNCV